MFARINAGSDCCKNAILEDFALARLSTGATLDKGLLSRTNSGAFAPVETAQRFRQLLAPCK